MKRLLIIPVIAALALVAGTAYGRWNSDDDHGGQSASAVPSEGIDVHGDWKIAIYNEDGSLDREYAFSNALRPNAAEALGRLLQDTYVLGGENVLVPGGWLLSFGSAVDSSQSPCSVARNVSAIIGANQGLTFACNAVPLNVEAISNGLRLSGSQDANVPDSVIDYVETTLRLTNSETGANAAVYAFTGTDVGPFTDIQDGQIIQVEVEITFDTPAP